MKLRAFIKQGKITIDKHRWQDYLNSFDGDCTIEVNKYVKDRTNEQNRLLWKFYEVISNETGDDVGSIHEFMKSKFLAPRFVKFKNEEIKLPGSTTKLTTTEFTNYITQISVLTQIPIPNIDNI